MRKYNIIGKTLRYRNKGQYMETTFELWDKSLKRKRKKRTNGIKTYKQQLYAVLKNWQISGK